MIAGGICTTVHNSWKLARHEESLTAGERALELALFLSSCTASYHISKRDTATV
jgi:hypothetical protein